MDDVERVLEVTCPVTDDAGQAVDGSGVVLLALFDAAACRGVIDLVTPALASGTVVVTTATIGPDQADELGGGIRAAGAEHVHAPVLGSVPAVEAGELVVLASGPPGAVERARPVLERLGEVLMVDDAARLKLLANAALAGAVVGLRACLQQATALGVPRRAALDILERSALGGLVARKRDHLDGRATRADFTVGALAKDADLLVSASGLSLPWAAELEGYPGDADEDVALAATAPAPDPAVLAPLEAYIRGHATGDPTHFRTAFLASAHVEGIRDGGFVSWSLDDYCARFTGTPAGDEGLRHRRIDSIDVRDTVATASMTLWHCPDVFTDVFLLVRQGDDWRIANKAFHREEGGGR